MRNLWLDGLARSEWGVGAKSADTASPDPKRKGDSDQQMDEQTETQWVAHPPHSLFQGCVCVLGCSPLCLAEAPPVRLVSPGDTLGFPTCPSPVSHRLSLRHTRQLPQPAPSWGQGLAEIPGAQTSPEAL